MKASRRSQRNRGEETPRVWALVRAPLCALLLLLIILAANIAAAFFNLGGWQFTFNVICAAISVVLIAFYFMEMRKEKALNRLMAAAGIAWLTLFLMLSFSDYATRILTPF